MALFVFLVTGAFSQEQVSRSIAPFTGLYVGDKITVQLIPSDRDSLTIQLQGIDPENIVSVVTNNILRINYSGKPFDKKRALINLYYKDIRSLDLQNGAEVTTTSIFKADNLMITLKSGATLYLDADIKQLKSYVIEGALLSAEGYATIHDIAVATSATVSAFDLESEVIKVKASSGGKAKINVEQELYAQTTSGGYISYKGNPEKKDIQAKPSNSIVVYEE